MHWNWPSKFFLLTSGFLMSLILGLVLFLFISEKDETRVIFLDVGQGDAILIVRGRTQLLIDGGRGGAELLEHLGKFVPFYDRTIETVIATHPDADHIGGLPALLDRYRVEYFFSTGATSETDTWKNLERALSGDTFAGAKMLAILGTTLDIPGGGMLSVLFPATPLPPEADETNTGSVVARFEFGETSFLFTGDLPEEELYLPESKPATVLKVAHHGSQSSTSDAWLDLIRPQEAVISVGKNSYGHPSPKVLERLRSRGTSILRTDEMGDIVYRCRTEWNACRRVGD